LDLNLTEIRKAYLSLNKKKQRERERQGEKEKREEGYSKCVCFLGSFCDCGLKKVSLKKMWLAKVNWI